MAVTAAQVQTRLRGSAYPCLSDDALTAVIERAEVELSHYKPVVQFKTFNTVADVQDYYIFDPDNATTVGCCAAANEVKDVFWAPSGTSISSSDIYDPAFHIMHNSLVMNGSVFHRPSDVDVLWQKIDAFKKRFGQQVWEVYGEVGDPTTILRLMPVPRDTMQVILQIGVNYTIADVISLARGMGRFLMQWIEVFAAEAIANDLSNTAGTVVGGFKDGTAGLDYWQKKYEAKLQFAIDQQGGPQGYVARG